MALLKTTEELREFVSVGLALQIETLEPSLRDIEENEVLPLLGEQLYQDLIEAYGNGSEPIDPQNKLAALLPFCQRILAGLALADTMDVNQISISESGITRHESDQEKTAFHYQKLEAQQYFRKIGYNGQESLLAYLEKNIAQFSEWKESEAYQAAKRFFIQSASEFSHYYNINNSRLTFRSLLYLMERAEQFQIKDTIGADLFARLKEELSGDGLSQENKTLLEYIKPAVAYLSIADATLELSLSVTSKGVLISSIAPGESGEKKDPAKDNQMEVLRGRAEGTGNRYLQKLREFLLASASADIYPLFYNSSLYPKTVSTSTRQPARDPRQRRIYGA